MSDDRWLRVEELFQQAAELPDQKCASFLAAACAGDDGMRSEVESLLAYDQSQNNVLVAAISDTASDPVSSTGNSVLADGTKLGSYLVETLLGTGGLGEVYRARDLRLGRNIAIEVLNEKTSGAPDGRGRFEREARATGALNHPNILPEYDFSLDNGRLYIASELAQGESLRERCLMPAPANGR